MNRKGAPFAGNALHRHFAAMGLDDVFDDRQPQTGAAQLSAARLIHAIKPFE
jgi:hypothetical protein